LANDLDGDAALVWLEQRFDDDEERATALVSDANLLYDVAFVERGEVRRVIRLRRANRREVSHYVENI
jgi:uncharacterized DUF497 family protein